MNESLLNFLSLVKKELGGDDARAEIGGRPPSAETAVFYDTADHLRIVVLFDAPPADPSGLRDRLAELSRGFIKTAAPPSLRLSRPVIDDSAAARLDDALQQLVERAGARVAAVADRSSPVLWGASFAAAESREVSTLLEAAESGSDEAPTDLELVGRAIALIRSEEDHGDGLFVEDRKGYVLRWFAGIYCLVVAFDRTASELKVESSVIRALPFIEKLVLSLPPLEPEPQGRKVIRMPFRLVRTTNR